MFLAGYFWRCASEPMLTSFQWHFAGRSNFRVSVLFGSGYAGLGPIETRAEPAKDTEVDSSLCNEGRALQLDLKKEELDLAIAKDKTLELDVVQETSETILANLLGFPAGDRVQPIREERLKVQIPESEEAALANAFESNKSLRILESKMQAKVKSYRAEWLPQFDLVTQYSLLAHYNFADSLRKSQPNNGELGVLLKLPLLFGPASKAYASRGEIEITKLMTQMQQTRTRIQTNIHQTYRELRRAESALDVSHKAVEWAQEQLRVLLERYEAGRIPPQRGRGGASARERQVVGIFCQQ